jgi:D-glycero-D-manno-heptose 1,7-bisphosphate phosphatase
MDIACRPLPTLRLKELLFGSQVQSFHHCDKCCNLCGAQANNAQMTSQRPALFLDRDGVINVDKGYVSQVADFEWIEGAAETIAAFKARGWFVFVVTNQSGIARDYYSEHDMHTLHEWMQERLAEQGAEIDRIYYCPYHDEGENPRYRRDSFDRKPKPGMLLKAMADFPVKRESSFLIGDKQTDIDAARAAGVAGFLFTGGDLFRFAEWTLAGFEEGNRG